jgi:hypothetical protein
MRVHWIVYSDNRYQYGGSVLCNGWTDYGKQAMTTCSGYLSEVVWQKSCKSCSETYQCDSYQCNPIQTCTQFTAKQGASAPAGAQNVKCAQGLESCGNGACESQYSETPDNCPADCKKTVCLMGELKCDNNILRVCNIQQTDWDFKENCLYSCSNNACVQGVCQDGQTQTTICPDNSTMIIANCVSNNWQNTGTQCLSITPENSQPTGQANYTNFYVIIFIIISMLYWSIVALSTSTPV